MAPVPKKSMIDDHFTHPGHTLAPIDNNQEYSCDGCKTMGTGKRYRCVVGCDFDLHEYCRTCPLKLSTFMHGHELNLVMRKAQNQRQVHRTCNLCSDPVEGLFYRCKTCEFDVHPLCTQLPKQLHHALHKSHLLNLESSKISGFCAVCNRVCSGWRYRCEPVNSTYTWSACWSRRCNARNRRARQKILRNRGVFLCSVKGSLTSRRHSLHLISDMGSRITVTLSLVTISSLVIRKACI